MTPAMPSDDNLFLYFMTGACAALAITFICYLAVAIYQLGYMEGEHHAAKKRTVAVHHFPKHREAAQGRQTSEAGGSDSGELRPTSEAQDKEPA